MPTIPINEQKNNRCGFGRKSGATNALTTNIKQTIAMIVNDELPKLAETLEIVKKKKPDNYVKLVLKMAELILPKKQEVEITNEDSIDIKATLEDMRQKIIAEKD